MGSKAAVSYSIDRDSYKAGKEMSHGALSNAGINKCDFALVFASSEHEPSKLLDGVKSVLGTDTQILGGTSAGVITNDYLGYDGAHAGIMIIATDEITFCTHIDPGFSNDEYESGRRIGSRISESNEYPDTNLLLFYDSTRRSNTELSPFMQANPILEGIKSELGTFPPTAGVGLVGGAMGVKRTEMWHNNDILNGALVSLMISGNIRLDTTIMHGCKPASNYHLITKVKGNKLLEFDGKPALEVAMDHLGIPDDVDWRNAMYLITIGVNKGDKYGPFIEEDYVNRIVLGVDENEGAIIVMEGDLKEGDSFQFMRRSINTDMIGDIARKLLESLGKRKPLFAFYISCLGRIKKYFGNEKEEAEEIQEAIGPDIPLLGIYSGTEIARVKNEIMPLDWTGVLCIFSSS